MWPSHTAGDGDGGPPLGPEGGGQLGLQICIYPDILFRVGVVGTLLVQHLKHLVTWVGAHPPVQGDFEVFWDVKKIRIFTGLLKVKPKCF